MLGDYSSLTRFCSPCIHIGLPYSSYPKEWSGILKAFAGTSFGGQKADYQRALPVAWDFVYKPKRAGGLGIIDCELWNYAAIAKHLWYIAKEKVCLWVKWVHGLCIQQQYLVYTNKGEYVLEKNTQSAREDIRIQPEYLAKFHLWWLLYSCRL